MRNSIFITVTPITKTAGDAGGVTSVTSERSTHLEHNNVPNSAIMCYYPAPSNRLL